MQVNGVRRGALIVLEGCDRVGKTTQGKLLVEALSEKQIPAQFLQFPDRTTCIGKILNEYLSNKTDVNDEAIHLMFSGNRWELESKIKQLLFNGTTLIVDRYAFSGTAYSAAKDHLSLEWCRQADVGLPKPDAVFLFHIGRDSLNLRPGFGEERYENDAFLSKVWSNFQELKDETFVEIDADKSKENLHMEVLQLALKTMDKAGLAPLGKLWTDTKPGLSKISHV